jgi:sugar/nucleoside kinase (ribokinase family)
MLEDMKLNALAGIDVARARELLRAAVCPGLDPREAAAEIAKWAHENGIEIDFDIRQVGDASPLEPHM